MFSRIFKSLPVAFVVAFLLSVSPLLAQVPAIEVHFSPGKDCTAAVVREVSKAREVIRVEACWFSLPEVSDALIEAKNHGRDVAVVLDKRGMGREAQRLLEAGITVVVEHDSKLAHNKVIIIDNEVVLTGSFNFTRSAEKNSENLVVIRSSQIAGQFLKNWNLHRGNSTVPVPEAQPKPKQTE